MRAHKSNPRAGFSLITIVLLIGLFTASALTVLKLVNSDMEEHAVTRRTQEARETAEGGLKEAINDHSVFVDLPTLTSANLKSSFTPPAKSTFAGSSNERGKADYAVSFELVRVSPLLESSQNVVRAMVYEANATSTMDSGTSAAVQAELYRVVSTRSGVVLPRLHAR